MVLIVKSNLVGPRVFVIKRITVLQLNAKMKRTIIYLMMACPADRIQIMFVVMDW